MLRLLPLMVGGGVPENEPPWEILMDLKEIVEIVVSDKFTEETLSYLAFKLSDHHLLLTATFPRFVLKPKRHFIQHYPHLIRCYGLLVDLWTMRFESKQSLQKNIIVKMIVRLQNAHTNTIRRIYILPTMCWILRSNKILAIVLGK